MEKQKAGGLIWVGKGYRRMNHEFVDAYLVLIRSCTFSQMHDDGN